MRKLSSTVCSLIMILAAHLLLAGCAAKHAHLEAPNEHLKQDWGIEITSLRLTAAGRMIDFRYKVHDAKKAEELFRRSNQPYLIDQKSGKVLAVPNTAKVGPLRNSDYPKENRIYWMFFGNTYGFVQHGSLVSIVIGDFRVENLVVN